MAQGSWSLCTICVRASAPTIFHPSETSIHRLDAIKQDIAIKNPHRNGLAAEVEPFLTERGIEHSYFPDIDESGNPHTVEQIGNRNRSRRKVLIGLGVRSDILTVTFEFDESEKLTKYPIQEVFTGP